ncbi:hypothetical protein PIB30_066030 [Stylosanthes scabra]|uniref:DUF8018 domain-containing protein n=1 Tax=Stylosanthes scabra TaxID=79078 RepID=A0ABU6SMA1_9FABA|nr:hypothetical protein [Stylosanthes scabra]
MSTHHILGLKKVPRVRLFADSSGKTAKSEPYYERTGLGQPMVYRLLCQKQRRAAKLVWKNCCAAGNPSLYKFSDEVFEQNFDRREVGSLDRSLLTKRWFYPGQASNQGDLEARRTILREEGCIPNGYEWREVLLCTSVTRLMRNPAPSKLDFRNNSWRQDLFVCASFSHAFLWSTTSTGASSSGYSDSNLSVNQPQPGEEAMPPAGPPNQGPSASTCPYPDDEIIGGDSVKSIRGRLLASEAMPSAEEIRFSHIEAEDQFEAKVDIIRQMASLDPEGDWERRGARALDNPRTKTGEESLGKLRDICDKLRLHNQLLKVFRRRDEDAGSEACPEDGPDATEQRPGSRFPTGRGTGDGHLEAHHDLQARPARPGKATR